MKKATSQDVAALAGVSQATVSLVLNKSQKANFSNDTRGRVFAAANQLGYRPPARSRETKERAPRRLLVFTPTLTNYYYIELLQRLQEYAQLNGFQTEVCNTYRDAGAERRCLERLRDTDGVVYTFLTAFPRLVEELAKTTPVVLIGEKPDDFNVLSIELSNRLTGALIAEHLCGLGHREFVFLSTPLNRVSLSREQRLEGLLGGCRAMGLGEQVTVMAARNGDERDITASGAPYEFEMGRRLALEALEKGSRATALIGVNDVTALGALAAVRARGLSCPKDVSVCGFDNTFPATLTSPELTTVDHRLRRRCKSAVDSITQMQAEGGWAKPQVNKIEFLPQLVVRGSTGPAR